MSAPTVVTQDFDTIDSLDGFLSAYDGSVIRAPKQEFRASLQSWQLPKFDIFHFEAMPFAGALGPPNSPVIGGPSICLVSTVRGKGITVPKHGEAYGSQAGDLEILGHEAEQQVEFIGDDTGITRTTAAYLPADDLRALGIRVTGNAFGQLPPSPLRSVIDTYFQAFGSLETLRGDADLLTGNFIELVGFALRGTMTPGVMDSPSVLYCHYRRALQFMRRHYLDSRLNASTVAQAVRISERTLFKAFSLQERSFHQELLETRLQRATARLATRVPGEKIATIAYDCGFDSLTTFNRVFKTRFGMRPRDFEALEGSVPEGAEILR